MYYIDKIIEMIMNEQCKSEPFMTEQKGPCS